MTLSVVFPEGLERFASREEFYSADERRRHSGEADYGLYWWDGLQGHSDTWRVSAVVRTGEIYAELAHALRRPYTYPELSPVVLLGTFAASEGDNMYEDADRILEGWNLECGKSASLQWAIDRVVDPGMRRPVSVLCRCQTLGTNVRAVVFVGPVGSRVRAGDLIMRAEEWEMFRAALERGFGAALDLDLDAPPEVEAAS